MSPADRSGPRELLPYRSAQGRWVVAAMVLGSSVAGIGIHDDIKHAGRSEGQQSSVSMRQRRPTSRSTSSASTFSRTVPAALHASSSIPWPIPARFAIDCMEASPDSARLALAASRMRER